MNKPTNEQIEALAKYANLRGRCWKHELTLDWAASFYADARLNDNDRALLQQVRNNFGPSWLYRFKLAGAIVDKAATEFNNVTRYTAESECDEYGVSNITLEVNQASGDLVRYDDYKKLLDAYNKLVAKR